MIGAYVTFVVQQTIRTSFPGLFDYSLLIAVPLALSRRRRDRRPDRAHHHPLPLWPAPGDAAGDLGPVAGAAAGGAHDVRPTNQEVGNPSWMSGASISARSPSPTIGCGSSASRSPCSRSCWRCCATPRSVSRCGAVTQNRRMAASMGIATSRVDALTFGLGSAIAGIAGVALSADRQCQSQSRARATSSTPSWWWCSAASVISGAPWSAPSRSHRQQVPGAVAGAVLGKIAILVLIILFIQKRPRGLFALKGRAVEA